MRYVNIPTNRINPRRKGLFVKRFLPVFAIISIVFLILILWSLFSGTKSVVNFILQQSSLQSTNDKVNILLLGNAGGIHDGAYLTDTIMIASYNLKDNKTYLISLPRDLWVDKTKSKLNAVYEIGAAKEDGLKFSKEIIGEILGIPLHYGLRLDFRGFIKAADEIGGVDVVVDRSFQDRLYPIEGQENDLCGWKEEEREFSEEEAKKLNIEPGRRKVIIKDDKIATDSAEVDKGYQYFTCRYETINFIAGVTHMDGSTALKFVRSRMGNNNEGNDFARSKRQQKIIEAFKQKALSVETLANPTKIKGLVEAFDQSIETDIPITDMLELYSLTKKTPGSQNYIISAAGPNALLVNPPLQDYGGAWVLVPKEGNFKLIHQFVDKILRGEASEYAATTSARTSDQ